jgi:uncharacterized membrane protein
MIALGSAVLWVLLVPGLATLGAVWFAIGRNRRARTLREDLALWPDRIVLVRHDPGRPARAWAANPHWVEVRLSPRGGPVPDYLTLRGAGREVELGAFLTEAERRDLHGALSRLMAGGPFAAPPPGGRTVDKPPGA